MSDACNTLSLSALLFRIMQLIVRLTKPFHNLSALSKKKLIIRWEEEVKRIVKKPTTILSKHQKRLWNSWIYVQNSNFIAFTNLCIRNSIREKIAHRLLLRTIVKNVCISQKFTLSLPVPPKKSRNVARFLLLSFSHQVLSALLNH